MRRCGWRSIRPAEAPYLGPCRRTSSRTRTSRRLRAPADGRGTPTGFWGSGDRIVWLVGADPDAVDADGLVRGESVGVKLAVIGWNTGVLGKLVFFIGFVTLAIVVLREFGVELPASIPESLVILALGVARNGVRADPRDLHPRRRAAGGRSRHRDLDQPAGCAGRDRRRVASSRRRALSSASRRAAPGAPAITSSGKWTPTYVRDTRSASRARRAGRAPRPEAPSTSRTRSRRRVARGERAGVRARRAWRRRAGRASHELEEVGRDRASEQPRGETEDGRPAERDRDDDARSRATSPTRRQCRTALRADRARRRGAPRSVARAGAPAPHPGATGRRSS